MSDKQDLTEIINILSLRVGVLLGKYDRLHQAYHHAMARAHYTNFKCDFCEGETQ